MNGGLWWMMADEGLMGNKQQRLMVALDGE